MIPTINSRGTFTFLAPYDSTINATQQYTVASIRSIQELQASGEDPLTNIYLSAGELEAVFTADVSNNVPIVTLRTDGGEYLYIPANKIVSDAKADGVPYVEKVLIVSLGYLPVSTDLTAVTQIVNDSVYDTLGVTPIIEPMDTSAIVNTTATKHATLEAVRVNQKTVDTSYRTRYQELLTLYNNQQVLIQNIEQVYRTNGIAG